MTKLILGTAEFNPKGYAGQPPVTVAEVEKILRCARIGGISILEGAETYNCDDVLNNDHFDLVYKANHPYNLDRILHRVGRSRLMGLLNHHTLDSRGQSAWPDPRVTYVGASVYHHKQILGSENIIEVPLNLNNREFENVTAPVKLVRSIFSRGDLLKDHTVKECLDFVRKNPTVHGVVVGVKSASELEQILKEWNV